MICFLCDNDEKNYTLMCIGCHRVYCTTCLDTEKELKTPILNTNNICIFCHYRYNIMEKVEIQKKKKPKPKPKKVKPPPILVHVERNVIIEFP